MTMANRPSGLAVAMDGKTSGRNFGWRRIPTPLAPRSPCANRFLMSRAMTDAREIDGFCTDCGNWTDLHGPAGDRRCRCGSGRVAVPPAGFRILGPDEVDEIAAALKLARRWMPGGHRNGLTATETLERDTVDAAIRALENAKLRERAEALSRAGRVTESDEQFKALVTDEMVDVSCDTYAKHYSPLDYRHTMRLALEAALRTMQAEPIGWTSQDHIDFLETGRREGRPSSIAVVHDRSNEKMGWTVPVYATPPAPASVPVVKGLDLHRDVVEKAFSDPVEYWPVGWRENYPALREPSAAEAKRRILAALSGAPAREGWELVPRKPTEAMIEDGVLAYNLTGIAGGIIKTAEEHVEFVWEAMLAASPTGEDA